MVVGWGRGERKEEGGGKREWKGRGHGHGSESAAGGAVRCAAAGGGFWFPFWSGGFPLSHATNRADATAKKIGKRVLATKVNFDFSEFRR